MPRQLLLHLFRWFEARLDAVFGARWNPLTQLGALGFFYYWVVAVSGIYLYIFFDTGTTEAYDSLEYLTRQQWYAGGIMRSLHRYASDGMVLMMGVHILREFAYGRFRGPRWFTWTTGVPLIGFVLVSGVTGYWLVWDELAQYIAVESAEWLDWLGLFGEPIARNFATPKSLDDRFFTLLMFVHIMVPLFLLLFLWIHLLRISRPAINPNRGLAIGTFVMLLALSLVKPAVSQAPADLTVMPAELAIDWFYLAAYPLMQVFSDGAVWGMVVSISLIFFLLPLLPPRWKDEAAVVHLDNCNGCARCFDDCPFDAIAMLPRSDGLPFEREAVVNPDLCLSCGICLGSCPTAMPFRRRSSLVAGIELPQLSALALRDSLDIPTETSADAAARDDAGAASSGPRITVFGCAHGALPEGWARENVTVVRLPCVGALPPPYIDYVLSRGGADGVVLCGCSESSCGFRFGPEWTKARIERRRDPFLRRRVPRERILEVWQAPGQPGAFEAAVAGFEQALTALPKTENSTPSGAQRDAQSDTSRAEKEETHA